MGFVALVCSAVATGGVETFVAADEGAGCSSAETQKAIIPKPSAMVAGFSKTMRHIRYLETWGRTVFPAMSATRAGWKLRRKVRSGGAD